MGGHGEGDVAVPAGVAADLVVVQAAFLLGGLEAFLHGPAAAGDADQVVECGVCRTVGNVVGDLLGPADTAAGDHPVPAVFAVPGPDLDPGPVIDAWSVGTVAAGAAFPLLPGQSWGNRSWTG